MAVIGGKSKKRYNKVTGDNGRTYTDDEGNSYNDSQFKEKEGDYTEEDTRPKGSYVQGGGLLSGGTATYQPDKYSSEKPKETEGLGALAKRIGMEKSQSSEDEEAKKKKKKLEGMP